MKKRNLLKGIVLVILLIGLGAKTSWSVDAKKNSTIPLANTLSLLDINTATKEELIALTGIGDVYAAKIVANRPYKAKNDLVRKKIIPMATYSKLKDHIIAKQ